LYKGRFFGAKTLASQGWHAEYDSHSTPKQLVLTIDRSITFERIPSDYAILKIIQVPDDVGGDTLWASGYEAFDRLSPVWQRFAEGLTATHHQVRTTVPNQDYGNISLTKI
jgi:alpha-ketoglutarate-dependent taurine dioxygenase